MPLDEEPVRPKPEPKPESKPQEAPDEPLPRKKGKAFFSRRGEDVMTPDQVLRPQEPEPAPEVPPAAQSEPEPVPQPEKKSRRGQESAAREVEQHAQEVSQAIEEELAEPEEAYQYPPVTLLDQNSDDNYTEVGAELPEQLPPPGPDHHQLRRGRQARGRGPRAQRHPV